jgi:hypothetical protein
MTEDPKQLITEDNPNVIQYVLAILGAFEESENAREEREKEGATKSHL